MENLPAGKSFADKMICHIDSFYNHCVDVGSESLVFFTQIDGIKLKRDDVKSTPMST